MMKSWTSIAIAGLMIASGLIILQPSTSANLSTTINPIIIQSSPPTTINREVLNLTFDDPNDVNNHFWLGSYLSGVRPSNYSFAWDSTNKTIRLLAQRNRTGTMIFGGFVPALETTISFSIKFDSPGFIGGSWSFQNFLAFLGIANYNTYLRCYYYYWDEGGSLHSFYYNTPTWGAGNLKWIKVQLSWYGNRSYHYKYSWDGGIIGEGWITRLRGDKPFDNPPTPWTSELPMSFDPGSSASYNTWYYCQLDNITQTIPVRLAPVYANIPRSKYTGLGFDGPYKVTIQNVLPVLSSLGARATWLFEIAQHNASDGWTEEDMRTILSMGQEFGIHVGNINVYNSTNVAILNEQFAFNFGLANQYGWNNHSFVWTSYGNNYDWPFNDYVYDHYASIGRKLFVHWYANLGTWVDYGTYAYFNFSSGAASRGIPYVGYNHRIGIPEDIPFNVWYDQVNTSIEHGLKIVGLGEYWFRYAAPNLVYATVSDMVLPRFTVEYPYFHVWNEFEISINRTAFGIDNRYLGIYDLTDNTGVSQVTYDGSDAVFNASDGHQYVIPVTATSTTDIVINVTHYAPNSNTVIRWTATKSNPTATVTYTLSGLRTDVGYKVYKDGKEIYRQHSGHTSLTFTVYGNSDYVVKVWDPYQVWSDTAEIAFMVGAVVALSAVIIKIFDRYARRG